MLLVGEIRDLETARIAAQASLTGHLLLSTVHTNDAVGTVVRLIDMGLEDYLLASVLKGVVAQRLVRALCRACRAPYDPPRELFERSGLAALAPEGARSTAPRAARRAAGRAIAAAPRSPSCWRSTSGSIP